MTSTSVWMSYFVFPALIYRVSAIDCYVCSSLNEEDDRCEDQFQMDLDTVDFIDRDCTYGYFKATHCIKLKGKKEDGTSILVRQCSDEDWGSHCGDIQYELGENAMEKIYGCLETCNFDGCNSAPLSVHSLSCLMLTIITIIIIN